MTQPRPGYLAVQPGHPEPEPIPEPEPPQPIPPPEPAPLPEPPHASAAAAAGADFIDAGPPADDLEWPPVGAYPGEPGYSVLADDQPTTSLPVRFLPTPELDQPTQAIPSMVERTQLIGDRLQPVETQPVETQRVKTEPAETQPVTSRPFETRPVETQPVRTQPGTPDQPTQAVPPLWEAPLPAAKPRPSKRLWAPLALAIALLLCGGGATSAYLLLRDAGSGRGAADPATAVNSFMTAVYAEGDASAAANMVCREARDEKKLNARVDQIKSYTSAYDQPAFRWSNPAVASQNDERALVTVQLTMSTDDEKQARQELTFTVVHKTGWQVCDIAG